MSNNNKTFAEIVEDFNDSAILSFNAQYKEYEPALKNLAFKYNSGSISQSNFFINLLLTQVEEWKGTQEYDNIDEVIKQSVVNKEYLVRGKEFPVRDFKRAEQANSITGLDMYNKGVAALSKAAADAPYNVMLKALRAGAGTTLGACFDGEPLFSTSHAFSNVSGSQSNLIAGSGISTPLLISDVQSAMAAMEGFSYSINAGSADDDDTRMLNEAPQYVILCNPALASKLRDISRLNTIVVDSSGGSQDNPLKGTFEVVTRHIDTANVNDYYIIDVSEATVKPFLIAIEDEGSLITPQDNPEALSNQQSLRYAYNGLSFGNAYGAWWKITKINNT